MPPGCNSPEVTAPWAAQHQGLRRSHRGSRRRVLRGRERHRAITREQAIAALADGPACIHCRPDTELGVL
ncbi:DUF6233 domain-containing protein [Streptomyces sp. NBC_01589]|uniref:DUF6233 domain-containing protein n=1 Tax=unclassified Streptomyces TaxID=2593676 RepID=UPI0038665F0B